MNSHKRCSLLVIGNYSKCLNDFSGDDYDRKKNRKNTSGKPEEAVYLYLESSKELVQANELNSALSLIQNVFDILKANTNLADETLKSKIYASYIIDLEIKPTTNIII